MALYRSLGARPDETRGTTALEVRKDLAGLFTGPGVLPGADSPLVVGSDVFAYVVRTAGWVTSRGPGDGVHLWGNDGDHTISEADDGSSLVAPAPGLSRIDVIYALHPSADENGDTTSEPFVAVRKGVEASVPVAPSLPVGGLELARNTMTSAAISTSSGGNTIAQTVARAQVGGGAFPYRRVRTAMSIPDSQVTTVSWLSDDVGEAISGLSYSGGVFTVGDGAAGLYAISASVGGPVLAGVQGDLRVFVERNGTRVKVGAAEKDSSGSRYLTASADVAAIWLAAGDGIRVRVTHRLGSWSADETYSFMQIARIR